MQFKQKTSTRTKQPATKLDGRCVLVMASYLDLNLITQLQLVAPQMPSIRKRRSHHHLQSGAAFTATRDTHGKVVLSRKFNGGLRETRERVRIMIFRHNGTSVLCSVKCFNKSFPDLRNRT